MKFQVPAQLGDSSTAPAAGDSNCIFLPPSPLSLPRPPPPTLGSIVFDSAASYDALIIEHEAFATVATLSQNHAVKMTSGLGPKISSESSNVRIFKI